MDIRHRVWLKVSLATPDLTPYFAAFVDAHQLNVNDRSHKDTCIEV